LPAQHAELMPEDEDLGVLRRLGPGQQTEPAHGRPEDQIGESQGHEPEIMPDPPGQ
jgi:hypothetical protein